MTRALCLFLVMVVFAAVAVCEAQAAPPYVRVTVGVTLGRHSPKVPASRLPFVPKAGSPEDGASFRDLGRASALSTSFFVFDETGTPHPICLVFFRTGRLSYRTSAYVHAAEVQSTPERPDAPRLLGEVDLHFRPNGRLASPRSFDQDDLFFAVSWSSTGETTPVRLRLRPLRLTRGTPNVTNIEVF